MATSALYLAAVSFPWWVSVVLVVVFVCALYLVRRVFGSRAAVFALLAGLCNGPFAAPLMAQEDDDFVIRNRCKELEPWSIPWIAWGCYAYTDDPLPTSTTQPAPKPPPKPVKK